MSGRAGGRRAFVTGASGGLGRGIAKLFLDEGAKVALADVRGAEEARSLLGGGGASMAVQLDVRDPSSVEAAVSEAWDVFGGLDILVNCAGVYPSDLIVDMTTEAWDNVIDTNLKGPFLCSRVMVSCAKGLSSCARRRMRDSIAGRSDSDTGLLKAKS